MNINRNILSFVLVCSVVFLPSIKTNADNTTGYVDKIFYKDGEVCNWWADDGSEWYFFQNGKKHNGYGVDGNGKRFFDSGKYANWWYDDGDDWYFFKDGVKFTGYEKDASGYHNFVNGKYKKEKSDGYVNGIFYKDGEVCNWWADDGEEWYFFQNGKKLTGYGKDSNGYHYFDNGKYANGWYDDKTDWYFFVDGKKHNGYGVDGNGKRFFDSGKYANWWYDDGEAWYFFKDGVKFTGTASDASGVHKFKNGKYDDGDSYDEGEWKVLGSNRYLKDKDGKIRTGFVKDSKGNLYFASNFANGAVQKNFFAYYNGKGYVFGNDAIGVETSNPRSSFIQTVAPHMVLAVRGKGLFPSVAIAQTCLETGFGSSTLGYPPVYNLFGIKAPSGASVGEYVEVWTTEEYNGVKVNTKDKFKKFNNYTEAFSYYAGLFTRNEWLKNHYRKVVNAKTVEEACKELTGTYATDSGYGKKLLNIIEQYNLREYDKQLFPTGEK